MSLKYFVNIKRVFVRSEIFSFKYKKIILLSSTWSPYLLCKKTTTSFQACLFSTGQTYLVNEHRELP